MPREAAARAARARMLQADPDRLMPPYAYPGWDPDGYGSDDSDPEPDDDLEMEMELLGGPYGRYGLQRRLR